MAQLLVMAPHPVPQRGLPSDYAEVLKDLMTQIRSAQIRAHRAVNTELIQLYWSIGKTILGRQALEGWGTKVIDRLASDLRQEFPQMTGLSPRNFRYMRTFAVAWSTIGQQPVAQLPWGHIAVLLDRVEVQATREWYAAEAVRNGWSRAVLLNMVKSHLHLRAGAAPSNFADVLAPADSELVEQLLKDPYNFEFLSLSEKVAERTLEDALVERLKTFLLELGHGFAFVGRQVPLTVDGDEFFVDLLFYHYVSHRFVVVELKVESFVPEYAGKLNFYVNVVHDQLAGPGDSETIGIPLCADKNARVVEYALRGLSTPIAVSQYELLPSEVRDVLPSAEELQQVVEGPLPGLRQLTISEYLAQLEKDQEDVSPSGE